MWNQDNGDGMGKESNFNVEKRPGVMILYCRRNLDAVFSREAVKLLRECLADPDCAERELVLDLADHVEVGPVFLREVAPVVKELKDRGKKLYAVQVPKAVQLYIKQSGMDGALNVIDALAAVLPQGQPVPERRAAPKIDMAFVNPFLKATIETLKIQCSIDLQPGKPQLRGSGPPPFQPEIAALIGLVSKTFRGSISICFTEGAFLGVMSRMLGEQYSSITSEIEDGAGELLNIIFGQAKKALNEQGSTIEKAIPTVIRGQAIVVRHLVPAPAIILPFESDVGGIYVEIGTEHH
jgi:chemotaxis protein CheX